MLLDRQQLLFRDLSSDNVVVARASAFARQEGLDEKYAWLTAACALAEENRRLMENALAPVRAGQAPPKSAAERPRQPVVVVRQPSEAVRPKAKEDA